MGGYAFNWSAVTASLGQLLAGLAVTLELACLSLVFATALGLIGSLFMRSRRRSVRLLAVGYVEVMRNSPSLVKMYFIYFGLPELGLFPSPFWSGVTALALHNAAYMMDVFRAAFASLPAGQVEAATSLGLRKLQAFYKVELPQAIPRALPGLSNYWVEMVKDTSLTSALSVRELYSVFSSLLSFNMRTYEFLIVIGGIYLLLTATVGMASRVIEARMSRVSPSS